MVVNLSRVTHALHLCMLTLFSIEEILLSRYAACRFEQILEAELLQNSSYMATYLSFRNYHSNKTNKTLNTAGEVKMSS